MINKMKDFPDSERPYERCEQYGPEALSDAELLAIIVRTGTKDKNVLDLCREILVRDADHPGLQGLCYLSREDLRDIPGIGPVKATQILCILELAKRIAYLQPEQEIRLGKPRTIANYYRQRLQYETQECVYAVYFNSKCGLLKQVLLTKGTVNASLLSPRDVMLEGLKCHAAQMVLVHNHPSGSPDPSGEDDAITTRIKAAGELLGIPLLDHVVVARNGYYSYLEHKKL